MNMALLELKDLDVGHGNVPALYDINLKIINNVEIVNILSAR